MKPNFEYVHRADVCIGNYVLEFQHSTISKAEFMKRNYFYAQAGYKVVWIFDYRNEYASGKMVCYDEWSRNGESGGKWKWNSAHKFMSSVSPQRNKMIKIIFQLSDDNSNFGYLELVNWAIEDYSGLSDYKRFYTSYSITNFEELYNKLLKGEL